MQANPARQTKALMIAADDSVVAYFLTNAKAGDLTQAVTDADLEPPVSYIVCISLRIDAS